MQMRRRRLLAGGLLATLLAGCGSGPPLTPAAEPGVAPAPGRPPTGQVVQVGPVAEGVVADPRTHLVAVGLRDPARLALLDGRMGQLRREVRVPGHVRHLQLQAPGGPLLVPAESADALLRVSLPDGTIVSQVPVGDFPHDATATASGTVAVANEFGGTVSVVEGDRVVHTFNDATQPGGVAAVGEQVAMVDVRENTLTVYDIARRTRIAELPAGQGPTHVIADRRGRLFVVDSRGGAILVYGLDPEPRRLVQIALPGRPYGITYDSTRDRLWVTLTERNVLVGLDLREDQLRVAARLPTIRQPNTVAVDSGTGRVFVASPAEGALQLIDPEADGPG